MDEFALAAHWAIVERGGRHTIRLSDDWKLLTRSAERQRLAVQLRATHLPAELAWNMPEVQVIDSAGALPLWWPVAAFHYHQPREDCKCTWPCRPQRLRL